MNKFLFAIAAIMVIACNNAENKSSADRKNGYGSKPVTTEDSLFHDVMNGHDTGMAKMGKLIGYEKRTRQAMDSIKALPTRKQDMSYLQSLDSLSRVLHDAELGMDNWMQEFRMDSATGNPEQRVRYLRGEKERVTKVNEGIREAMKAFERRFEGI